MDSRKAVSWGAGNGVYNVAGRHLIKNQIVGVYGGSVVKEKEGDYILEVARPNGSTIWVDADPVRTEHGTIFGIMNEDYHGGR